MRLFHRLGCLSMIALAAAPALGAAAPASSPYYGRWTVADERPAFTAKGREYKTFDMAPCGNDFCGVSVGAGGRCGAVLFRFLGHRARDADSQLQGHARWGTARKNVVIYSYEPGEGQAAARMLNLYLGDGYDFGERGGSMPKFRAQYKRIAAAQCKAR